MLLRILHTGEVVCTLGFRTSLGVYGSRAKVCEGEERHVGAGLHAEGARLSSSSGRGGGVRPGSYQTLLSGFWISSRLGKGGGDMKGAGAQLLLGLDENGISKSVFYTDLVQFPAARLGGYHRGSSP